MTSRAGDWLGGIGAATWFFLPIAAASVDAPLTMMWQPIHTAELATSWVAVAAAGAACLAVARSNAAAWIRVTALGAVFVPVALTALNLIARHFRSDLATPSVAGWLVATLGVLALAACVTLGWRRGERVVGRQLRYGLTTSSLLIVPFWIGVWQLTTHTNQNAPGGYGASLGGTSRCRDIDVILLDELSYGAVFRNGQPSLPGLATLAGSARVYHRASAPAMATQPSVASYLSDLPPARVSFVDDTPMFIRDDGGRTPLRNELTHRGLFREAKRLGYATEVFGWYFPYCEELGEMADTCRSFSMYNAGTLTRGFAPLESLVTVANLWPYQWPTGLFKRPAAVWLHGAELAELRRLAATTPGPGPVLRWIHFNVPHRPWLEGNGWFGADAFAPNPRRYEQQLAQVDRAVTSALDGLRAAGRYDDATIVLTSDHGARDGLRPESLLWVPLIVHAPGQSQREDVGSDVDVRRVLNDIFSVACSVAH